MVLRVTGVFPQNNWLARFSKDPGPQNLQVTDFFPFYLNSEGREEGKDDF